MSPRSLHPCFGHSASNAIHGGEHADDPLPCQGHFGLIFSIFFLQLLCLFCQFVFRVFKRISTAH